MRIKIRYLNIVGHTLGKKREEVEIPEKTGLVDLFEILTEKYGEKFSRFLFAPDTRTIKRHALIIINGIIVRNPSTVSDIPENAELAIGVMAAGG